MSTRSSFPAGLNWVPAILFVLSASAPAQERQPIEPPASIDMKTAPEPTFRSDRLPARPAAAPRGAPAPKGVDLSPPSAPLRLDPTRVHYAQTNEGAIWARGNAFKMSFDAQGATYFPALGKRQPRSAPHALSPDAVTLGGEPLAFERAAAATRDGDAITIDRGAFVERYDLTPASIEQTFVFDTLPTSGDLVVRIPVASELEASSCDDRLEFRGELGRVTYGFATAIDASGRRAAASTQLSGGAITIRVDESFLATAELPLVIDPVVTTFAIDASGHDNYWADAAYDVANHIWLVVYEEWFSASDRDAFYVFLNDAGAYAGGTYLDLSVASWDSVHCANNASAQQFMVVSSVTYGAQVYIMASTISATGVPGTQTVVTGTEFGTIRNCVIGGDPYLGAGGSYYCIVYERQYSATDWDILVRLIAPDGTLVGTGPNYFSNSGATIDVFPAVSKSNGEHDWMIAWQRNIGTTGDADMWGGIVHWSGANTATPFLINSATFPEWNCSVSSPLTNSMRYLVTYQATFAGENDVVMALLDGTAVVDLENLSLIEGYNVLLDQIEPSVDSDGNHFVVAYSELYAGPDYDIYASDVFVNGNSLGLAQTRVNLDYSTSRDHTPRLASAFSGGSPDASLKHRFLAAWNSTPYSGGAADVKGGLFDTLAGGTKTPFCFGDGTQGACPCANSGGTGRGCANSVNASGALLTMTGQPSTVEDTLAMQVSGMPSTSVCTFFQGSSYGAAAAFGDGLRCAAGTLVRIGTATASGGNASYPNGGDPSISVKGMIPNGGATVSYQVSYRNAAVFCTAATFNITNGMIVQWAH
jgi:hypothetical protein